MSKNIYLAAGHAIGHNRGFVTVNGRKNNEGDNNIRIEKKLYDYLTKNYIVNVGMLMNTRNKYIDYDLSYRASQGKGNDLYMAIHSNAGPSDATGVEIILSYQSLAHYKLAEDLTKTISKTLGIPNRGVKFRNRNNGNFETKAQASRYTPNWYGELLNNKANAAMLVEAFFHTNSNDVRKFYANEDKLVKNVGDTIARYFGLKKKGGGKVENRKVKFVYDANAGKSKGDRKTYTLYTEPNKLKPLKGGQFTTRKFNITDIVVGKKYIWGITYDTGKKRYIHLADNIGELVRK